MAAMSGRTSRQSAGDGAPAAAGGRRRGAGIAAALAACLLAQPAAAEAGVESFNQWAFEVNRAVQDAMVRPGVAAYERKVPPAVQAWIGRAYRTFMEPVTATSHAIEGDLVGAAASTARFVVNGTVGLAGTVDVAESIGLPESDKTFSQAVCRSGLPLGAYVVLPVIGPTTAGIALTAGALMVGSTYALSLVSIHLAVASVAVDVIGTAAALENTVTGAVAADAGYEAERQRFIDDLARRCRSA